MPISAATRRLPSWLACIAAGAVATLGYTLLPAGGWWHAIGYATIGAACVAAVLYAVRRYRPQQPSTWYAFIAGLGVWLASSILNQLTTEPPWPTISGLVVLAGYPLMCWALIGLIRGRARADDRTALIDAGIVAAGLGLLYWTFVVGATVIDGGLPWLQRLVALCTAVGDIALFVLGSLLVTTPGARTASYRLLLAALLLTAVSDILTIALPPASSGPPGVLALLGNTLAAAAALHPSMRRLTTPLSDPPRFVRPRLGLLATAILLAPAVNLYLGFTGRIEQDWLAAGVGCVVLFLLVTLRMAGLVRRVETQACRLDLLAHHDALTGLPNRRYWDEQLPATRAACAATGDALIVGLLDLDHFKQYNDTHGHQAGDDLLSAAAAAWRRQLRGGDLLARYGGEEFALLLTARTMTEAVGILERMLAATPHGQTFSAGLARWDGVQSAPDLLHLADRRLYASKDAGRARITGEECGPEGARSVQPSQVTAAVPAQSPVTGT